MLIDELQPGMIANQTICDARGTILIAQVFLPKISNPSLLNFVDRIGFKMIPVEKYRKLQTEEKGIRKVFS